MRARQHDIRHSTPLTDDVARKVHPSAKLLDEDEPRAYNLLNIRTRRGLAAQGQQADEDSRDQEVESEDNGRGGQGKGAPEHGRAYCRVWSYREPSSFWENREPNSRMSWLVEVSMR